MSTETKTIHIDGAEGEGGGQILRTSLALALLTGRPLEVSNIRAGRRKPGLMRQHLTAAKAVAEISGGHLEGASLGSRSLTLHPGSTRPGSYRFSVGSAGSAMLVLQTVLLPLALADGPSRLRLEGGTHNPGAPPFDFLALAYLPLLRRMGPRVEITLERPGYYPAGGGQVRVDIEPCPRLGALSLLDRGDIVERRAIARVANLAPSIAERELEEIGRLLSWGPELREVEEVEGAIGPGNVVSLRIRSAEVTEVFTAFGRKGLSAERVARQAAKEAKAYLASAAPVGPYLADQLLLPMALGAGGAFRTGPPSQHLLTHARLIQRFLGKEIRIEKEDHEDHVDGAATWRVTVEAAREERAS